MLCEQDIFFVQPCLAVALSVIFPIRDLLCRPREQVNLVESPPLTQLHDLFTEIPHELSGAAVLGARPAVTGAIHVVSSRHIRHTDGMNYNVTVEISGFLMPVCMGADKGDVAREMLLAELLAYGLYLFQRKTVILPVSGIKGENVMMSLDVSGLLVLTILQIGLDALQGKAVRGTENAGDEILLSGNVVTILVQKGALGLLVMLKAEVERSGGVVGVLTGNVLDNCHSSC